MLKDKNTVLCRNREQAANMCDPIILHKEDVFGYIMHLCYEGSKGYGTVNEFSQPRIELAGRSHEHTYLDRDC